MKELWIEIPESFPDDLKHQIIKSASAVCDVILTSTKDEKEAEKSGVKIASSSLESDISVLSVFEEEKVNTLKNVGKLIVVKIEISGKEDEKIAVKASDLAVDYIILSCKNWKVIPLENLIAQTRGKSKLLVSVSSAKEAKLALETLELGADGVVLKTADPTDLLETALLIKQENQKVDLVTLTIVEVKAIGLGARVCIDTCDLMKQGEGILLGCQSSGLFLIQAEVHESPYVETRPFRVNAGPVSLYTLSPSNRTRYLSELKAGDEVLIVDREGKTRTTNVARVKIEWRPMVIVEAEYAGKRFAIIVQNAETIRFVTLDGSQSVMKLETGDEVLAHVAEGGRHFGTLVKDETVIER